MSTTAVLSIEARLAIQDLYAEYAAAIDDSRLEAWLDLFTDECSYRIVPRENYDAGLPLALVLCDTKNMLRDRVAALREANEYAIHTDRHIVSGIRLRGIRDGHIDLEADFAVYHTDSEGEASLFAVGVYKDEVVVADGRARFVAKTVIMDNSCVPHAISTPL